MFALGFVSVFDQVLEGLPDGERESLFQSYISALDEDDSKYRQVPYLLKRHHSCFAIAYFQAHCLASTLLC